MDETEFDSQSKPTASASYHGCHVCQEKLASLFALVDVCFFRSLNTTILASMLLAAHATMLAALASFQAR